jgi:hypothetical protein
LTHGFKAEKMLGFLNLQRESRGMPNDQPGNGVEALGRSKLMAAGDDRGLLALETQLDDLVAQLIAAQKENGELMASSDQLQAVPDRAVDGTESVYVNEVQTKHVEAILARLYPIERAIIAAPAYTIIGLGVKARHAAYVMSHYWEEPTDKIDWEAQTIRLLIEAVCDVARTSLSFRRRER